MLLIQYLIPLAINLSGSTVYYTMLGSVPLSVAAPVINALAFVFTVIGGYVCGEQIGSARTWAGIGIVLAGVTICSL
jgi:multidrug transporter EmrE-like cation transporter